MNLRTIFKEFYLSFYFFCYFILHPQQLVSSFCFFVFFFILVNYGDMGACILANSIVPASVV